MEPGRKLTKVDDGIDFKAIEDSMYVLTPQQQAWVDYKAVGGIVYEADDRMRKMTVGEFAARVGTSRETLYSWRNQIPNFWERVDERRKTLGKTEWLVKMHEKWKIKALEFENWQISEAWLINFDPSYKTPKVKVDVKHEAGSSWANLLRGKQDFIEGEVVDGTADQSE